MIFAIAFASLQILHGGDAKYARIFGIPNSLGDAKYARIFGIPSPSYFRLRRHSFSREDSTAGRIRLCDLRYSFYFPS